MAMVSNLIKGIVYSEFDDIRGPIPIYYTDPNLSNSLLNLISVIALDTLTRESVEDSKSLAIIPFPAYDKKGIIRGFEWNDEEKRGGTSSGSVSVIFDENDDLIFYKYHKNFEAVFDEVVKEIKRIKSMKLDEKEIVNQLVAFNKKLVTLLQELSDNEFQMKSEDDFPIEEEDSNELEFSFKVVVCGDAACGKTSAIMRLTDIAFRRVYIPTIGVNITKKVINVNGSKIRLVLWDIAGQAKHQMMRRHFYEGANGVVLLFDLTRADTYENASKWYKDIMRNIKQKDLPIAALCGNKNDLVNERHVSNEKGKELAEKLGIKYFEMSALTGENIFELFNYIGSNLMSKK